MRPSFINSFQPSQVTPDPFKPLNVEQDSFGYPQSWPGTIADLSYPDTFTGFDTPLATASDNFGYEQNWPGTIADPLYPDTFIGFTTPLATESETFDATPPSPPSWPA
jgi:hypothetical protein